MCDGCCNSFGGVTGDMYATPFNTIGMGDVMPASVFNIGSGDKLTSIKNPKKNKDKKQSNNDFLMTPPLIVYSK